MARKKTGGRTTPKGTGSNRTDPQPQNDFDPDPIPDADLELFEAIQAAVDEHPISLLGLASTFVDSVDPRSGSFLDEAPDPDETLADLVEMASIGGRETDALALAVAALLDDETAVPTVRAAIADPSWLPTWLGAIDDVTVGEIVEVSHLLGDADQIAVEAIFADGRHLVAVILVDNNEGGVVIDGFVAPITIDEYRQMVDDADDPYSTVAALDRADARARLLEAIDLGFQVMPPFETETWPDSRPLVEWLIRRLPGGGTAPTFEPITQVEKASIRAAFLASPHAGALAPATLELLDTMLTYKGGYGRCDPYRWSPDTIAGFLLDWAPRKLVMPASDLAGLPELVAAFTAFGHERLGLPAGLTDETLEAMAEIEEEFRRVVSSA